MSSKPQLPELKRYMEKRLAIKLNAGRQVTGTLRGFDHFMNLVLDDAVEDVSLTEKRPIGKIVSCIVFMIQFLVDAIPCDLKCTQVIRGNSVVQMEALDRVWKDDAAAPAVVPPA
jgi:small nuclear ribonucleoprotein G